MLGFFVDGPPDSLQHRGRDIARHVRYTHARLSRPRKRRQQKLDPSDDLADSGHVKTAFQHLGIQAGAEAGTR